MTDALVAALDDWPWVLPVLVLVTLAATQGTKVLAFFKESVSTLIGWIKPISVRERDRLDAELVDLRRQVDYLTQQIAELRGRDECYWEFVLYDQSYHRALELVAMEKGWPVPEHTGFMDFREEWLKRHKEYQPFA